MNKEEEKYTAIVYSKKDAIDFRNQNIQAYQILPLTANAFVELNKDKNLNILDLNDFNLKLKLLKIVANLKKINHLSNQLIKENKSLSTATKETLKVILPKAVSVSLYLYYITKDNAPWLINDGNSWLKTSDIDKLINIILDKSSQGAFGMQINKKQSFIFFISIINKIIFNINNNNLPIWVTGRVYKLDELIYKIKEKNPNINVFKFVTADKFSLIRSLISLISIFNPFKKIKIINIVPIIEKGKDNYYEVIKSIISKSLPNELKIATDVILNNIFGCIQYTLSVEKYSNYIFDNNKVKLVIAHELRWLESVGLASAANKKNVPVYLITHSTHSLTNDSASKYVQFINGYGLIFSNLASYTIIQSPSAEKFINKFYESANQKIYQPLMWGSYAVKDYKNINKKNFTILYADTIKPLSIIPYIYETSIEYINNLQKILNAVKFSSNIKIVIRLRETNEIDLETLNSFLTKNNNIEIKTNGKFSLDLEEADLLISHSSTTIEEALYSRKPVALYGGKNSYYHLHGSKQPPTKKKRSAVYHINDNNIEIMLNSIIESHFSSMLTDEELKDYVWSKDVPGINNFVNNLII